MTQPVLVMLSDGIVKKDHSELNLLKDSVTYSAELVCGSYKVSYKDEKFVTFSKNKFNRFFKKVSP